MTDTTALAAFLAARLDEDEAIARHAGSCDFYDDVDDSVPLADERNHILRHAPARVLREVAAKRAILDQSEVEVEYGRQVDFDVRDALDSAVRHLAAVYSDHPAYLPEWAP